MWRVAVIGVFLCLSLLMFVWIDLVEVWTAKDGKKPVLNSMTKKGRIYHWVEFIGRLLPFIALVTAWRIEDTFAIFNKFPEHNTRVSIM